jgi:hypothetical protein
MAAMAMAAWEIFADADGGAALRFRAGVVQS